LELQSGDVLHLAITTDITKEKTHNHQLTKAKEEAEAANSAKSEFLANMSHEIRTPMSAILGFTEVLQEKNQNSEDGDTLETIHRNGEHLLQILNDILDLSKIDAGKMSVEKIACSPAEIAQDAVSLMKARAEEKGIELTLNLNTALPQLIESDPTRLRQIFLNLIGNAVKFTHEGKVEFNLSLVKDEQEYSMLECEVLDTGVGISEEQLSRLFSPFSQADNSVTRNFGGSGLGLVICKRMAEMMGGRIEVTSELGKGSSFKMFVDIGQVDDSLSPAKTRENTGSLNLSDDKISAQSAGHLDCRILLVEDGPDNQRLISMLLRNAGADVELANNGQEALGMLLPELQAENKTEQFDVVLMDMQMPVLDGYSATRQLREKGYQKPVIALTAHAMAGDRQKCLDAGCDEYLTKPIKKGDLLDLVQSMICNSVTT